MPRRGTTGTNTTTSREYHSSPIPQQVRFPARSKIVKTYGKRTASSSARNSLRQQTLTQIFPVGMRGEGSELLVDDGDEPLGEEGETTVVDKKGKGKGGRARDAKRRKTMGDTPNQPGSSFHTQKITQFLSSAVKGEEGEEGDEKLIRDSQDEDDDDVGMDDTFAFLPKEESPELVSEKKKAPVGRKTRSTSGKAKGKGKAKEEAQTEVSTVPKTPTTKRIKVNIDEVPSSQPTPFTPLIGYSPIGPYRSPLKNKSTTNTGPATTTTTTTSETKQTPKHPRHLEIQDSYSIGGSSPFSIHQSPSPSPLKKTPMSIRSKPKPQTVSKRQPLGELPVPVPAEDQDEDEEAVEEQGTPTKPRAGAGGGSSAAKASTGSGGGKKRAFVEIPDSEDDDDESFAGSPSSSAAVSSNKVGTKTPTRQRVTAPPPPPDSAKENRTPKPVETRKKEDEDEEMEEPPGTPTPIARRSEVLRTREEVPSSSAEDGMDYESDEGVISPLVPSSLAQATSRGGLGVDGPRAAVEQPTATRHGGDTSQVSRTPSTKRRVQIELPSMNDEEHASDEEVLKETPHRVKPAITNNTTTTKPSPPSATGGGRRKVVQIELPPPSTTTKVAEQPAEEEEEDILKETPHRTTKTTRFSSPKTKISPRQPQKSPIVGRSQHRSQRLTQRSQLYSQGLESQRVPFEIIRAMGRPTGTSDVFITVSPQHLDEITSGIRDHEFRPHILPGVRAWFYATEPVNEVKYMATLGQPALKPGEVDESTGVGNGEFNRGESYWEGSTVSGSASGSFGGSGSMRSSGGQGEQNKFAYKLLQVYQLNNPVKKDELEEHGFGKGLPMKWRLLPPAAVGDLLANLRCALFAEEGEDDELEAIAEEGEEEEDEEMGEAPAPAAAEETAEKESQADHGVTVSQELEEQLRSDMIRSETQMQSVEDDPAAVTAARMPGLRHDSSTIASSPQRPLRTPARVTSSGSKKARSSQPRMTVTKVTKKQVQVTTTAKRYQFAQLEMEEDEDEDEDDGDLDLDKGGMETPPAATRTAPRSRSTKAASASASASKSSTSTGRKSTGDRTSISQQTTQSQTQTQTQSQSQVGTRQTRRHSQRLTSSQQELVESQPRSTRKALQERASMLPPPSPAKARPNYNTARPSQATTASGPSSPIIPPRPDDEDEQEELSLPQLPGTGRGQATNRTGNMTKAPSKMQHSESLTASDVTESSVVRPALPDEADDSHILLSSSSLPEGAERSGSVTPKGNTRSRRGTRTPGSGRTTRGLGLGRLPPMSSQGMSASLGPDSLLVDVEGVRAPPELQLGGLREMDSEVDEDETASEDDGDLN
ncbi:hypothetical protein B0T20DRAFT_458965 [Sordaria brevicollis]|uniref:Uncharacterized protein n=1 Tax=Sordaria brevicollis TaxID=83679 RepID=A0AAE0PL66_SORBR|nr:hypothetical protein B0T20DRAFT_458965 [Sordaria brevicollis]